MAPNKASKEKSKLSRLMKGPIRILIKVRDFYIQSLVICDGQMNHAGAMGCPTGAQVYTLPKSFSVNSSRSSSNDEDFKELMRAASTRNLGNKIELDLRRKEQLRLRGGANNNNMGRSYSVGIGRIDEDKVCEFEEDLKVKPDLFPRSRSYAVPKSNLIGA